MRRPPREELVQRRLLPSDYNPIFLKYEIIDQLAAHVEARGTREEGVFRISGDSQAVRELWNYFSKDKPLKLYKYTKPNDIHTVTGALKLYLREQPIPLIPFKHYTQFIQAMQLSSEEQLSTLKALIKELPENNQRILKRLAEMWIAIVEKAEENKMNDKNIGTGNFTHAQCRYVCACACVRVCVCACVAEFAKCSDRRSCDQRPSRSACSLTRDSLRNAFRG